MEELLVTADRKKANRPRAPFDEAVDIVAQHRRHVELSPGIGKEVQDYALMLCDDIAMDLQLAQKNRKRK
jgi:hypothetical protein